MYRCKFKYELEDCLFSAKQVYLSQRRTKDKVITFMVPFLFVICIGLLILDIVNKKSIVWDIVLLVALAVLEVVSLSLPSIVAKSQKKTFAQVGMADMDYIVITIDNSVCTEQLFKDEQEKSKLTHNLRALTSFIEDNSRLILVFNSAEYVCIKKACFEGDINAFKEFLQKQMSKNINNKK